MEALLSMIREAKATGQMDVDKAEDLAEAAFESSAIRFAVFEKIAQRGEKNNHK